MTMQTFVVVLFGWMSVSVGCHQGDIICPVRIFILLNLCISEKSNMDSDDEFSENEDPLKTTSDQKVWGWLVPSTTGFKMPVW